MATKSNVIDILNASSSVAIYIHINVDCDAMGSALALREALLGLGKQVDVFVNSNLPNNFKFYGDLSFLNKKTCTKKYDLAVCLDAANEARIGKYRYSYRKQTKNTLLIDHHDLVSTFFCRTNYVVHSSSTAEILCDIFKAWKIKFTKTICKFLLSGIITDTGKFMHSVSPHTFEVAADLLKMGGLTMEEIVQPLLNSMKFEVFELLKRAYDRMEFYADRRLAIVMFSKEDFEQSGANSDELDVFPDLPLQLESVQFAVLASEDNEGYFRVSFRSKGDVSAKDVAAAFGGGGHQNASGCKIFGEFDEVKQKLLSTSCEVLKWKK